MIDIRCTHTCSAITLGFCLVSSILLLPSTTRADEVDTIEEFILEAGHPSLESWKLPEPDYPGSNKSTKYRIALGKKLFFDTRLSNNGDMSCATCHNPDLGWSDGLETARGDNGKILRRATPTIINTAYNFLSMWDGRFENLEAQAPAPFANKDEMNIPLKRVLNLLKNDSQYTEAFALAYPEEDINVKTLGMAIAAFERTIISQDSPFDQWVGGEKSAMTEAQVNGFKVFLDPKRGNCVICHNPPNFSDNGYHNIGLEEDSENPDIGRYELVPIRVMERAFKTPTLRDINTTAPYFHDGSAQTLAAVLDHYLLVDNSQGNLSPALERTKMTDLEQDNLLDFLDALTGTTLHHFSPDSKNSENAQTPITIKHTELQDH